MAGDLGEDAARKDKQELYCLRPPDKPTLYVIENYFSYFSTKIYVVGTQENSLNETVLLSTQNTFKLIDMEKHNF